MSVHGQWLSAALLLASSSAAVGENWFPCPNPYHHDGDAIRCGGKGRSDRLYAIDAPEMPGACRPGRQCTPGDPYAARDHLRALTGGKAVVCRQLDTDRYGRPVVQCFADGVDLSCAMVRDGFAVERYGRLDC
jgi:endonuclease YncB( thermonuclease family)